MCCQKKYRTDENIQNLAHMHIPVNKKVKIPYSKMETFPFCINCGSIRGDIVTLAKSIS
jgi:hypothetical protein